MSRSQNQGSIRVLKRIILERQF